MDKNQDFGSNNEEKLEELGEEILEEIVDTANEVDSDAKESNDEEYEALKDKFIRLQADFTNYKRRVEGEKEAYIELGVKKISTDLLNIVDNFQRALEASDNKEDPFFQGIELIEKQTIELLDKNNIYEIDAIENDFDPNYHYAVMTEAVDGVEAGKVIEVLQKGYTLNGKVLRPAVVKVSE